MDYFSILNLSREPFSNSPDPDYFYHSRQHVDCLQKLELSLHLRRGLNVIIGDVGTGKTTLCRQLIRRFAQRQEIETHLILDPLFKDSADFLSTVVKLLSGKRPPEGTTDWQAKEFIKHSLFRKGVDQKKTTILIIDEGQKIPLFCLELLREFLNYETNEYKLLQIVIFAQNEFDAVIRGQPNFADRINLYHHLKPLSLQDTRMMINFRLEKSSSTPQQLKIFTFPALVAIYRATGGFPRKIINLCHQCILAMIIQNRSTVGYGMVRRCANRAFTMEARGRWRLPAASAAAVALAAVLVWTQVSDRFPTPRLDGFGTQRAEKSAREPAMAPVPTPPAAAPGRTVPVPAPAAEAAPVPAVQAQSAALESEPVAVAGATPVPAAPQRAAPPKPTPEAGGFNPPAAQKLPETLGTLNLHRNETLSGLIHKIYGQYSNKHFRSIILANPAIDDPDRVFVGHPVRLPAIPLSVKPLNKEARWVKIGEKPSLQEAYDLLRAYPESAPPARMIPLWRPAVGYRFAVVLKQVFSDPETARRQLERLPSEYAATGQVVASWGEQTVFFADPYLVNK